MLNSLSEFKFWIAKTLDMYKGYQIKEWFLAVDITPQGDYVNDEWGDGDNIEKAYEWIEEYVEGDGFPEYAVNNIGESLMDGRGDYYGWVVFEKEGRNPIWIERKYEDNSYEGWWTLCSVPNHLDTANDYLKKRNDEWEGEYIRYEFENEKRRGAESEIIFRSHTFGDKRLIKKIIEDNVCLENWGVYGMRLRITPTVNSLDNGYILVFDYEETGYKFTTVSMSIKQISHFLISATEEIEKLKSKGKISFGDVRAVLENLESANGALVETTTTPNTTGMTF